MIRFTAMWQTDKLVLCCSKVCGAELDTSAYNQEPLSCTLHKMQTGEACRWAVRVVGPIHRFPTLMGRGIEMGQKNNARRSLRNFVTETLNNTRDLRQFSVQEVAQAGRQVEQAAAPMGTFSRWAVVFLIIFVLFILLIPDLGEQGEDES